MNKIKGLFTSLINWYFSLKSQLKLLVTIIAVVILAILVSLISRINVGTKIIDYKDLSGDYAVSNLQLVSNRNTFLATNDIIEKMLFANYGQFTLNDKKVKVKDYYDYSLYGEYKISYFKFKDIVKNISNDVFEGKDTSNLTSGVVYPIVKNIYLLHKDENMYMCELNSNTRHFIGIKIEDDKYYIFYVE